MVEIGRKRVNPFAGTEIFERLLVLFSFCDVRFARPLFYSITKVILGLGRATRAATLWTLGRPL